MWYLVSRCAACGGALPRPAWIFFCTPSICAAACLAMAEDAPRVPATTTQAARVLDLRTSALVDGAKITGKRNLARLSYDVPGEPKPVYEFHMQQLIEQKWEELPGSYVSDQAASAAFSRDGFVVSVTVMPASGTDKAGQISVSVTNHGNVDLQKLPLPPGTKPLYQFPLAAAWMAEAPVPETAEACRKLLLAKGWEPYGTAGDSQFFRRNAVRLTATVAAAPAQAGKTAITYSSELMSVELPVPADAVRVQYSDSPAVLSFDLAAAEADAVAFYRQSLGKSDWKPTTEKPVAVDFRHELIFLNPAKDRLTLELTQVEGKTRGLLKYQTAAEVAEIERLLAAEAERLRKEREKPLPKISIAVPADATDVEQTKSRIEFKVKVGKSRGVVDDWRKKFKDAGWKEENATVEAMFGNVTLTKDGMSFSITWVETGILPDEITVSASRADLERAK